MSSQTPISQYLFALQSLPLLGSGLYTLLSPASAAQSPYLPLRGVSIGTIQAMRQSLSSLTLGTFYALVAYQNNTQMMVATIPTRFLAAVVFYRTGEEAWKQVAPFEAVMGVVTAVGVWLWGVWKTGLPVRSAVLKPHAGSADVAPRLNFLRGGDRGRNWFGGLLMGVVLEREEICLLGG
ncbi:hypothetical protein ASPNIDRAFT_43752 [Aspergillus niger ATCC 1015]|uniref:Uncharacterized protein n=1 Tax=Aspergillus niger (strain ATCC 1015 / CBS 113.46 / FGSC A1144 / LSHB Ac4 / NCTC 3858a / NRRL 328 / USDA 3528.7) TaxID=380704 RepID=G3XUK8_ASPNA|nr:hypothetical protein ASPNIDRAFT_43752 [Aspergillus niger ATCC 1015]